MRIATLLPGLSGRGVLLAAPVDAERVRLTLAGSGFAVAEVGKTPLPTRNRLR